MKVLDVKKILSENPECLVGFVLPGKALIPEHAHVTEIARIDKRFIDCGGTLRNESLCRLQTWVAEDVDHRLTAGKLSKIFNKAKEVLLQDDLDVDIEYEAGQISQFPVDSIEVLGGQVLFHLSTRHTACLAMEQCCPPEPKPFNPFTVRFTPTKTS